MSESPQSATILKGLASMLVLGILAVWGGLTLARSIVAGG